MLTHGAMRGCGLTSLVVCINDKFCDIRERNVTIRSEIWTTNIRSLGFQDVRECVTLWRLILRSLGCIMFMPKSSMLEANQIYTAVLSKFKWWSSIPLTRLVPSSQLQAYVLKEKKKNHRIGIAITLWRHAIGSIFINPKVLVCRLNIWSDLSHSPKWEAWWWDLWHKKEVDTIGTMEHDKCN